MATNPNLNERRSVADNAMVEKRKRWLWQRKALCAYGICSRKPVEEFNGELYCRRCLRYAKARALRDSFNRLAAAAPDLLAACEELLAWLGKGTALSNGAKCETLGDAKEQARAAIAKAKGERA